MLSAGIFAYLRGSLLGGLEMGLSDTLIAQAPTRPWTNPHYCTNKQTSQG